MVSVMIGYFWTIVGLISNKTWRIGYGEGYSQVVDSRSLWIADNWIVVFAIFVSLTLLGLMIKWSKSWIFNVVGFILIWISSAILCIDSFKGDMGLHREAVVQIPLFIGGYGAIFPVTFIMIVIYVIINSKMRLTRRCSGAHDV